MIIKFWNRPICRKGPGAALPSRTQPPYPPGPAAVLTLVAAWGEVGLVYFPSSSEPVVGHILLWLEEAFLHKPSLLFFPSHFFLFASCVCIIDNLFSLAQWGFLLSVFPAYRILASKMMVIYVTLYVPHASPVIATAGPQRTWTQELPTLWVDWNLYTVSHPLLPMF